MDEQQQQPASFMDKLNTDFKTLWENNKLFLVGFGLLILVIKFRDVIIDLLVANSKKTLETAVQTDKQLKSEEDKANAQANQLVSEAKQLDQNKPVVDENWNKKK